MIRPMPPRAARLFENLARGPIAFALAAVLVVGLTVLELTRHRETVAEGSATHALTNGDPPSASFDLIGGPTPVASTTWVTDPDAISSALPILLWGVQRGPRSARLTPWTLTSHRGWIVGPTVTLPGGPVSASAFVGVGIWGSARRHVALVAQPRAGSVDVDVRDLGAGGALVASGTTPPLGPAPPYGRTFAFAQWTGSPYEDLYIIDRARDQGQMLVRIYSGESGFRDLVFLTRVQFGGFPAADWTLNVGEVNSTEPDLTLTTRSLHTQSGDGEIHVLQATSGYRAWGEQTALPVPASATRSGALAIGHINGIPFLYVITPGSRTVRLLRL
jgi:hypothetical protein